MFGPELTAMFKVFALFRSGLIASATTTNGQANDITGLAGKGLVILSCDTVGGTLDVDFQQADDSGFTANVEAVTVTASGLPTVSAFTQVGAGAASLQKRSIHLRGRRAFLRARAISGAGTTATKATVILVAGGVPEAPVA